MTPRLTPTLSVVTAVFLSVSLAACNLPVGVTTPDLSGLEQTVQAQVRMTSAVLSPATEAPPSDAPATDPPPTPTSTFTPTFTPSPSATPTVTWTPIPCNRAEFVTDVTVPDGTDFLPNAHFSKTWRLRNVGTCTWTSEYSIVFDHGDHMGGPDSAQLTGGTIPPGGTLDVSVGLEAPGSAGAYKGYWKVRDPGGVIFGVGASGNVPFFVDIEVVPAAPSGPDFSLAFQNLHDCAAGPYATFRVGNTGSTGFESIWLRIVDTDTSGALYPGGSNNSPFLGTSNECPPKNSSMGPGSVYFIAAFIGASPPHGHHAKLTLKMCTADNQAGTCLTKELDFVVP